MLKKLVASKWAPAFLAATVFLLGATVFAEAVATALVDAGHDSATIRIERYGITGGL